MAIQGIGTWYNALVRDATIEALCMVLKVKIKSEVKKIDSQSQIQFEKKTFIQLLRCGFKNWFFFFSD